MTAVWELASVSQSPLTVRLQQVFRFWQRMTTLCAGRPEDHSAVPR